MAQIEIKSRFVEVTKNIALTKEGTKIEHLYLIYTDDQGNQNSQRIIRGGPEETGRYQDHENPTFPQNPFLGNLNAIEGSFNEQSVDWRKSGDFDHTNLLIAYGSEADVSQLWTLMKLRAAQITTQQYDYELFLGQNSNTVVKSVVDYAEANASAQLTNDTNFTGFDIPQRDGINVIVPGVAEKFSHDPLSPEAEIQQTALKNIWEAAKLGLVDVTLWPENIRIAIEAAADILSPLVIDVNQDGQIDLVSVENSTARFDLDGDGFAEKTGWVTDGDGLLVHDVNTNGTIDDITELFGNGQEEGFTELALLDSNDDGIISAADADFDDLQIWIDANENGFSESNELFSLADFNIASINLANTRVDIDNEGNTVTNDGSLTYADGTQGDIVDVWFQVDQMNSQYTQDFTLDSRVLTMPTLRGYGDIADLYAAMSIDNGTGGLLEMVDTFVDRDFTALLNDSALTDDMQAILYHWAGVDGIATDSRGGNINARDLEFLEKLTGTPYLQNNYFPNPASGAAAALSDIFDDALESLMGRLVVQTVARDLFEGGATYNMATDEFTNIGELDTTALAALETEAGSAPDALYFWQNVIRVIHGAKGEVNLTANDIARLDTVIGNTLTGEDYQSVYDSYYTDPASNGINGDANDNTLNGTSGVDWINGNDGNDTITGGIGDDVITGGNGDDTITGGVGTDIIEGGAGDDTYIYNLGDGADVYIETGIAALNDKILFGAGIDSNDLTMTRINNDDLYIQIDTGTQTGSVILQGQFSSGAIETLEFDDATTLDLTALSYTLTGTEDHDSLVGASQAADLDDTIYGMGGNDTIHAGAGVDTVYGGGGNDTIYGSVTTLASDVSYLYGGIGDDLIIAGGGDDQLTGGTGNDVLQGYLGNDSYYFEYGDGDDEINDTGDAGSGDINTLYLGAGILEADVDYERVGSEGLKILIDNGNGGSVYINNQFNQAYANGVIQYIELDDSTVIDLSTQNYEQIGTSAAETLYGLSSPSDASDSLYGMGGNDNLFGGNGADYLDGGAGDDVLRGNYPGYASDDDHLRGGTGDDYLYGGAGEDHYYFAYGDGNDYLREQTRSETNTLHFDSGVSQNDITFERSGNYDLNVLVDGGTGGSIEIYQQFYSSAGGVKYIQFEDGGTIDLTTISYTYTGTASGETMYGTGLYSSGNDIMYGMGGNDHIRGWDGDDTLYGGEGSDTIYGDYNGNGDDHITGGAGDDTLYGNEGADHYYFAYGDGDDQIQEQGRNDTNHLHFTGGIGQADLSLVRVGAYDLEILVDDGTGGSILLKNHLHTSYGAVKEIHFDTDASIDLTTWTYTFTGTSAGETIHGANFFGQEDDILYGMDGNDYIYAHNGDDILDGGAGGDYLNGGYGNDTASFASSTGSVNASLATGSATGQGSDTLLNIENLSGSDYMDVLTGDSNDNILTGGDGADTLTGNAGADTFAFEAATAFNDIDTITDFDTGEGDALDIGDMLFAYDPLEDALADFIEITDDGTDSTVKVDMDGTGTTHSFAQFATLEDVTGLTDEAALLANGNLII